MYHPALYGAVHVRMRLALRAAGKTFFEINEAMRYVDGPFIDGVAVGFLVPASAQDAPAVAADGVQNAIGDGTIIQAILDWLRSPEGQALIAALVKMLLALLAGI